MAIRVARRDARRYKWRSALIVAMVGLPVLLLTGGITLVATMDVSMAESVPRVMGSAQGRIYINGPGRQVQSPDSRFNRNLSSSALAVPGFAAGSDWTASKVQKVTGGRVIQTLDGWLRVTLGDRRPTMAVLGIDARDPLARGMTELVSGRWASTASEVVVTEAGIANGLPREGTLTTSGGDGRPQQLSVVGVATGQTAQGPPFLVALPGLVTSVGDQSRVSAAFLIGREPVTWADVRRLNDYGLLVQSRQVFLNPPPQAELDPQIAQMVGSNKGQDLFVLLAAVGIFIETTLLAGPAFAVSAARQRHSLALAAANGAEARQLRRYVLGQAVVLGVVSAAVAVFAGLLLTLAGLAWWQAGHADFATGPFEVSWLRVLGVFSCAVVASVVAALLPAKGIARLDIVSVLAGRTGDHRVHRGLPIAGAGVMALSSTGLILSVAALGKAGPGTQAPLVVVGAVGLVLGCLMVIPAVLAFVGRLGTRLVLPLRLAARDTARQRGRSTPAVAAIMAAVAALTALSIGGASYAQHGQDTYQPQGPMGSGTIGLTGGEASQRDTRAVLNQFAPQLEVDPVGYLTSNDPSMAKSGEVPWVNLVPPGCTAAQILAVLERSKDSATAPTRCANLSNQTTVHISNLSSYPAALHLSKSERAVLEAGGMLFTDLKLVQDGQVRFVSGTATLGAAEVISGHAITQHTRIPAVVVDRRVWATAFNGELDGAWILPDTAKKLGWPVQIREFNLTSPTGTISPQVESAVADRLGDGAFLQVERGFQNPFRLILLIAFSVAGLLVLIASLISTALSLAESQNDMATLAAVGATRHTRRGIAASQALVVSACGALLGVAVGMIPGIASTWPLTARDSLPPTIAIPWLPLLAVCIGVPLLAAGLAWIAVRHRPQMTRRLA